jgi:hypothetical protein
MHDLGDSFAQTRTWLHQHGDLEKHVQKEITNAVKESEGWIVSHRGDFRQLGKDALWAMDHVHDAGKSLSELADDIIAVSNAARAMGGWYDSWPAPLRALIEHSDTVANLAHDAHNIPKSVSALAAEIARNKAADEARRRHGYGDLNPPGGVLRVRNPGDPFPVKRQHTREVVIRHQIDGPNDAANMPYTTSCEKPCMT